MRGVAGSSEIQDRDQARFARALGTTTPLPDRDPYEYHPSTSTTTLTAPARSKIDICPVPGLMVATTMLARISPTAGLRSDDTGTGRAGNTVRKVGWFGWMPVRLTATAVAPWGTPAKPRMFKVSGVPETMGCPLHWAGAPERFEGLPALVSQIRTGAASALN